MQQIGSSSLERWRCMVFDVVKRVKRFLITLFVILISKTRGGVSFRNMVRNCHLFSFADSFQRFCLFIAQFSIHTYMFAFCLQRNFRVIFHAELGIRVRSPRFISHKKAAKKKIIEKSLSSGHRSNLHNSQFADDHLSLLFWIISLKK